MKKGVLKLENGYTLNGSGFGLDGCVEGELVFNTGMVGYMESITDPSYKGQILVFSYPLIGNYGATFKWGESRKIQVKGVVVSEVCFDAWHRLMDDSLDELFKKQNVLGISGIDTRALVRTIRDKGTMLAELMVGGGTNAHPERFKNPIIRGEPSVYNESGKKTVVLIDFGAKEGIIEELVKRGLRVVVFGEDVTNEDLALLKPNGVVLSNGPGDPTDYKNGIEISKELLKIGIPILGICLGHQLLALAAGGRTYKLKFGHRGINQPVIKVGTKRAYITSQNHGFAVDYESMPKGWGELYRNLNDGTNEGLIRKDKKVFSVQFHPEANPGPYDTRGVFDEFLSYL